MCVYLFSLFIYRCSVVGLINNLNEVLIDFDHLTYNNVEAMKLIRLEENKSEKQQIREKRSKDLSRLKKLLRNGVVEFSYKKKDGSVRKAKGTLKDELLPETDKDDERRKNINKECFYYFDLKKDDYRCFLRDNFIEIKEKKNKK